MRVIGRLGIVVLGIMTLACAQATQAAPKKIKKAVIKLKPHIREEALRDSTPTIALSTLKPFLRRSLVLDKAQQFEKMPYVLSEAEGRVLSGAGSSIYVRGIQDSEESIYDIYRALGRTYIHPETKEVLGFEAFAIGTASLQEEGDPATFQIQEAQEVVESGARLAPSFASELPLSLKLKPAKTLAQGYILSAKDTSATTMTTASNGVGPGSVVTISMGHREGLEEGDTLDIYRSRKPVADPKGKKGWRAERVSLPERRIGQLLVFQSYAKLSLALVLQSTESIDLLDTVKRPQSTR